jgi:hypothetical protein
MQKKKVKELPLRNFIYSGLPFWGFPVKGLLLFFPRFTFCFHLLAPGGLPYRYSREVISMDSGLLEHF